LVGLPDVRAAQVVLAGVAARTPLVDYAEPGDRGRRLRLKAESLQPTGAFKLRGAYHAIAALPAERRACGVVTHSSGNHAQAVAYAARLLGVPAVVVMPDTASAVKAAATEGYGAEVVRVPVADRVTRAEQLAAEYGYALIPPYDDAHVVAGQGTVGLEIAEDAPETDLVLVPVSGGGLISGVAIAVKALLPHAAVVGVEPELAGDARASLAAGERVSWPADQLARTIADGLRVPQLGDLPWEHVRRLVDGVVTVAEEEIREAMRRVARYARLVAEPSGAVPVAAALFHTGELPPARHPVAVLSGGNVDPVLLAEVLLAETPSG